MNTTPTPIIERHGNLEKVRLGLHYLGVVTATWETTGFAAKLPNGRLIASCETRNGAVDALVSFHHSSLEATK